MKTMTVEEFQAALKAQGVPSHKHAAFICPMCQTVQSANDLIAAGAGDNFEEVEKFVGFSCVGRFKNAKSARLKPNGQPCDWTLGGFFKLHKLEVITTDGQQHPRFEIASPEQAQANAAKPRKYANP
jgi:hypothetical protein